MLELKPNSTGAYRGIRNTAEGKQPRKLMLALVLLLVALAGVVIEDRQFWFGTDDSTLDSDGTEVVTASAAVPNSAVPKLPSALPTTSQPATRKSARNSAKNTKKLVPAGKSAADPTPAAQPEATDATAVTRTVLPPLDVEVVAGDKHHKLHPGSNAAKVEITRPSDSAAIAAEAPANDAADRERLSTNPAAPAATYPLLAQQMRVEGSVVLQALIGADGVIQNLHVLSGPGILSSAAQQAVREWHFKPIMQNGQAVESQAKITVNFNIKIADGSGKTTIAESRPLIIESIAR